MEQKKETFAIYRITGRWPFHHKARVAEVTAEQVELMVPGAIHRLDEDEAWDRALVP